MTRPAEAEPLGPGAAATGALVTGAGRGLGRELARLLADRGHRVHVTDLDAGCAEQTAALIGRGASWSPLDVRDAAACRAAASQVLDRSGSLAVWVNNAGVLRTGPAWEQDDADRRLMLEVNALGTINGTLAALEPMRAAGRGHVLNVVSLAGLVAAPGETVYSASKHAALAFSLGTLSDLRLAGVTGVHISCVCPDGIWTPMLFDRLDDPAAALSFSGRLLQPAEVVAAVDRLLDAPRPVRAVPGWRGAQARVADALPRVALRTAPVLMALARRQQRRLRRRLAADRQA